MKVWVLVSIGQEEGEEDHINSVHVSKESAIKKAGQFISLYRIEDYELEDRT